MFSWLPVALIQKLFSVCRSVCSLLVTVCVCQYWSLDLDPSVSVDLSVPCLSLWLLIFSEHFDFRRVRHLTFHAHLLTVMGTTLAAPLFPRVHWSVRCPCVSPHRVQTSWSCHQSYAVLFIFCQVSLSLSPLPVHHLPPLPFHVCICNF